MPSTVARHSTLLARFGHAPTGHGQESIKESIPPVKEDKKQAVELLSVTAEKLIPRAMFHLGEKHEDGMGVTKGNNKALVWSESTTALGDETAKHSLESEKRSAPSQQQPERTPCG